MNRSWKRIYSLLFLALFGAANRSMCGCVPPPSNMVAWWPLNETSGQLVEDIVGPFDGTAQPGDIGNFSDPGPVSSYYWHPSTFPVGMVDYSLFFYLNRYVEVSHNTALEPGTGSFTIDAWVITCGHSGGPTVEETIARKTIVAGISTTSPLSTSGYQQTIIVPVSGACILRFAAKGSSGSLSLDAPITPNIWHHVAATLETNGGICTLYLDGVPVASTLVSLGYITNTANLLIGGDGVLAGEIAVDEVEIFNCALNSDDVLNISQGGSDGKCKCSTGTLDTLSINTGYDHSTGSAYPLNPGQLDDYWTVVAHIGTTSIGSLPRQANVISVSSPSTVWHQPFADSQWIGAFPTSEDSNLGITAFVYTFFVCCEGDKTGAELEMDILVDDFAEVYLNGNLIGAITTSGGGFASPPLQPIFTNNALYFVTGENKLRVEVDNEWVSQMGLDISGTVKAPDLRLTTCQGFQRLTYVRESERVLENYELMQCYPTPFNPTTTIRFKVAVPGFTTLKVYDVIGREITTLVNEVLAPGTYERIFNAQGLTSGVYFYRLVAGSFTETKKFMLLR